MAEAVVPICFASPLISVLQENPILIGKEERELKVLENLHSNLRQIESVAEDAEEIQLKNAVVRSWLRMLKNKLYDAGDILDMYEVDLLPKKKRDAELSLQKRVILFTRSFFSSKKSKDGAQSSRAKVILSITKSLDKILQHGKEVVPTGMVRSTSQVIPGLFQERPITSSLVDDRTESTFVGRDDVKEEMIKHLVPGTRRRRVHPVDDANRLSVLPIVGMGGLGKTTLAKFVFNDKRVVEFYKSRVWVCLGQSYNIYPKKIMREINETMMYIRGKKEAPNFNTLEESHSAPVPEIGEPFLLVLDDAWDRDRVTWGKLLACLEATKKIGRVIVTTRDEKVADAFPNRLHVIRLDFLDDTSMWSIFKKNAFSSENATESSVLEPVGKQIVAKLKGLPLAAKVIGASLSGSRNQGDWRAFLESDQLPNNKNQEANFMRQISMLSYSILPTIVKQYFLCFSLFPRDYQFCRYAHHNIHNKDMWMIERVLFLDEAGLNSKDETYDCVDELLSRSLLQASNSWSGITISMHDLVYSMAVLMSKEEFLHISDAHVTETIPEDIRHISFFQKSIDKHSDILKNLIRSKSLRTLLYNNTNERLEDSRGLLDGWFICLRYLRVLSLHNNWITILPDSIGNLRLLRYLDLFLPKIKELPETISKLCKLKGLNLRGCDNLRKLPSSITRLVNLMHLDVDLMLLRKVVGIGQFTNLRELEEFYVKEKEGHSITELENMNELCGSLYINGLDRVEAIDDAKQARLDQKPKLKSLNLTWCDGITDGECQVDIIKGLRPSTYLKQLSIAGYCGTCLPKWLTGSYLTSLHRLEVTGCSNLIEIPSLPSTLRSLHLFNNGIKSLFSSASTICMPSLWDLEVRESGELDESLNALLEASSSSLKSLAIWGNNCPLEGLSYVTALQELELRDCKKWVILNPTALISLRKMKIENCPNIVVHGHCSDSEICSSSLTSLMIERSPMLLESLSQCGVLLNSLIYLDISCESDDLTFCHCLRNATALEYLRLQSCSNITSLPAKLMNKLAAIKKLEIRDCCKLEELEFPLVVDISIIIWNCPKLSFRKSSPLLNPVIKGLYVIRFSGEQLLELFSVLLNTPIKSIKLIECVITYDVVKPMLGGVTRNATLEELEISSCQWVSGVFSSVENLRNLYIRSFPVLSSLVSLRIEECQSLAFTRGDASTMLFPSLEILDAIGFSALQLTDLIKGLTKSPIKRITISKCYDMESFDGDLISALLAFKNSLERLSIIDCPNLGCPSTRLQEFEALCKLEIYSCPKMTALPDGLPPTSLQTLHVDDCPALEALYEDGNQWLSNIPEVKLWRALEAQYADGNYWLSDISQVKFGRGKVVPGFGALEELNFKDDDIYDSELNQKESVEETKPVWCSDENKEIQSIGIEGLCSTTKTPELVIQEYSGTLQSWLIDQSVSLTGLLKLEISGCPNILEIPFLPSTLRDLKLSNVGVKSLFSSGSPIHLPYLQNLEVMWCSELNESLNDLLKAASSSIQYVKISGCNCPLRVFSNVSTLLKLVVERCRERVVLNSTALFSLRTLHIAQCPHVVIEGTCLDSEICSSLTSLKIHGCPTLLKSFCQLGVLLTSLTDLYFSSNCDDSIPSKYMDDTKAFVCLRSLTISECPTLVELDFHDLRYLRSLYIRDCPHLTFRSSFSNPCLEDMYVSGLKVQQLVDLIIGLSKSPIKSLTIENCYDMESFDGKLELAFLALNSLKCLHIRGCLKLNCLPSYLGVFEALRSLKIEKCPRMSTLPDGDLPIYLQELWIINCPALEAEYKQNVSRQACISYIPYVHIEKGVNYSAASRVTI